MRRKRQRRALPMLRNPGQQYSPGGILLSKAPREALPSGKNGWDEFVLPRFHIWFQDNWVGRKIETAVVVNYAEVKREPEDDPKDLAHWRVTIHLLEDSFNFANGSYKGGVVAPLEFLGDEAFAKKSKLLKKGAKLKLLGTIDAVYTNLSKGEHPSGAFKLKLSQYTIIDGL